MRSVALEEKPMTDNLPEVKQPRKFNVTEDPVDFLDTAKFEQMMRVARAMAMASLVPDHLKVFTLADGSRCMKLDEAIKSGTPLFLDVEASTGNCFLICNTAVQWQMDPFQLAQVTYVQRGRVGFEGKVIQAVLSRRLGPFDFEYSGSGENLKITVTNQRPEDQKRVSVEGTFRQWATKQSDG